MGVHNKKIFEKILDQIREMLVNEQLAVGHKIPSEIRMAQSLGVSRASLREALRILNVLGMIEAKTGEGTVICKARPKNLTNLMTLVALSGGIGTVDLYEARCALEVQASMLAAVRRNSSDLKRMRIALDEIEKSFDDHASAKADYMFHRAVVQASQNEVMMMLMSFVSDLLGEQIRDTRKRLPAHVSVCFQMQHWKIFAGIQKRDPELAGFAMREHLTYARQLIGIAPGLGTDH